MNTSVSTLTFAGGALFGLTLALCLGAVQPSKPGLTNQAALPSGQSPSIEQDDWSRLKFFTYPNGGTGIFDPATRLIYVYDTDLNRCYMVREVRSLGQPLRRR